MNNPDQDKQDQRINSGMEDSSVTIEFLRARLLAERSVSRTARQRADELAKRVAELEEQLRIVSVQRMKAEKAAADVLAILEGNGISDISETYDSTSDQDSHSESKVGNRSSKDEENSVNSKVRNNESDEISSSDPDYSTVPGRSLSWKGRKDSTRSLEKYNDSSLRRRSTFSSVGSSPKQRPGKSCRQIRHKESRSAAEEYKTNPAKHDSVEDETATSSENFPDSTNFEPKREDEKTLVEDSHSACLANEQNASDGVDYTVCGENRDMEKALEHQAQLIGRYEEMEKAQREWEEKFRENNNSTPDSCDHGNRSDITEEQYEIRAPTIDPAAQNGFQTQEMRSENEDSSKIQSNGFLPSSHINEVSLERKHSVTPTSESSTQDFAFPMAVEKHNQDSLDNGYCPQSDIHQPNLVPSCSHCSSGSQSMSSIPSNTASSSNKGKAASESHNEHHALVPHQPPNGLGGVLEALKEARQSLQQRIDRLPLVPVHVEKSVASFAHPAVPGDKMQIPVGCIGLFRLPTDYAAEGNSQAGLLGSNVQLRLENHYSDYVAPAATGNHFVSSPYWESRSSSISEDQFLARQYVAGGSRNLTPRPYFDPYLDTGLPSSSRYAYPSYPINTTFPDMMPRIPSREAFSSTIPGRTMSMPMTNNFSFSDDNIRPNMYR